jgi:dihydrofolate reductase
MTTGHVYIACSLDGFIARTDGGIDWLMADPPSDLMERYAAFMADKDAIVMGRATFDIVRGFDPWPYEVPVVVLSRTLGARDLPSDLAGKVRVDAGDPAHVMARLTATGCRRAYVDGGATVSAFLAAGLIEDMTITRLPILLGRGIPLFRDIPETPLRHVRTEVLDNGAVVSRYSR